MFVAKVPAAAANAPPLRLDAAENSAYKWVPLSELGGLEAEGKLHPVMGKLLARHWPAVLAAAGVAAPSG